MPTRKEYTIAKVNEKRYGEQNRNCTREIKENMPDEESS